MIKISSAMTRERFDTDLQVPQSLPRMATSLMMRKLMRQPQRLGCRVSLKWASCSGVSAGRDMLADTGGLGPIAVRTILN